MISAFLRKPIASILFFALCSGWSFEAQASIARLLVVVQPYAPSCRYYRPVGTMEPPVALCSKSFMATITELSGEPRTLDVLCGDRRRMVLKMRFQTVPNVPMKLPVRDFSTGKSCLLRSDEGSFRIY